MKCVKRTIDSYGKKNASTAKCYNLLPCTAYNVQETQSEPSTVSTQLVNGPN